MKINKFTLSLMAAAFAVSSTQAALITLNNGASATASGIQTVEGLTFRGGTLPGDLLGGTNGGISAGPGTVAFGIFTTTINQDSTDFSSFVAFGNILEFSAAGAFGNRSVFSLPQNVTVAGSDFAGKNIILFAGNGTSFGNSSQVLVVDTGIAFNSVSDSNPSPTSFTVRPSTSTVLFGSTVANVLTTNTDASVTGGWSMKAVPEPSAALLGALGALGLLRRRRI
jgi:MYXO-CTERM domain-containing protein